MEKLFIDNLFLEVTRNCTLECKHCFRGDRQNKYMSIETIEKIFKDVKFINKLLLTGGEPLLAINQLEAICKQIIQNEIKINKITIITNGTVLSAEILKILKFFSQIAELELDISEDFFHISEIEAKGLKDKRNKNLATFKELFKIDEWTSTIDDAYVIKKLGRAKNLTNEAIEEINKNNLTNIKYVLEDETETNERHNYIFPYITGSYVYNQLYIDVNGNIVPTYYSYEEEDKTVCASLQENNTLRDTLESIKEEQKSKKL